MRFSRIYAMVFVFLILNSAPVFGGLFDPGTRLYTIRTGHFEFVYPLESQDTAYLVAKNAEPILQRLNSYLSNTTLWPITVIITPHIEDANGMFNPVPINQILIYDTVPPAGSSIGNYSNYILDLFTHELTHAVSLTIRFTAEEWLAKVMGNWILPQVYMMPEFMVEGVTVSFESLDGFERVNHPSSTHMLKQDLLENRFKGLSQVTGAYDLYPYGNIYYIYGGLFSDYLQQKYGMDKYRVLWHRTGVGNPFRLLPGEFKKAYGAKLRNEWNEFKKTMIIAPPVITNTNTITKRDGNISSPVSVGKLIYYIDYFSYEIRVFNTETGKDRAVLRTDWYIENIDVSPDGQTLLISGFLLKNGREKRAVLFYDLVKKRYLPRRIRGLREAVFFGNDIVGIELDKHITSLVRIREDGMKTVLVPGHETLSVGSPKRLDNSRIVFLLKYQGIDHIAIFDIHPPRQITIIQPVRVSTAFMEDNPREAILGTYSGTNTPFPTRYPLHLNTGGGRIFYSYNNDYTMYKLAVLDPGQKKAYIQTNNISGGVFSSVVVNNDVYYAGHFSRGHRLMRGSEIISGTETACTETLFSETSFPATESTNRFSALPYRNGKYLLPKVWAPMMNNGRGFNSLGLFTYITDPIQNNLIQAIVTYHFIRHFVNWDIAWYNSATPIYIQVLLSDNLLQGAATNSFYRFTSGVVDLSHTWYFVPIFRRLTVGTSLSFSAYVFDPGDGTHPYTWAYSYRNMVWTLYGGFSTLMGKYQFYDYRGLSFNLFFDHQFKDNVQKMEGIFRFSPDFVKIIFNFYGGIGTTPMFNLSGMNVYFGSDRYSGYSEYANQISLSWYYLNANAYFPLFNIEIQTGPGATPFYLNRFYTLLGYRASYISEQYYHSAFLRVYLTGTLGYVLPTHLYAEVNLGFNKNLSDIKNAIGFNYGFQIDTSFLTGDRRKGKTSEIDCIP